MDFSGSRKVSSTGRAWGRCLQMPQKTGVKYTPLAGWGPGLGESAQSRSVQPAITVLLPLPSHALKNHTRTWPLPPAGHRNPCFLWGCRPPPAPTTTTSQRRNQDEAAALDKPNCCLTRNGFLAPLRSPGLPTGPASDSRPHPDPEAQPGLRFLSLSLLPLSQESALFTAEGQRLLPS